MRRSIISELNLERFPFSRCKEVLEENKRGGKEEEKKTNTEDSLLLNLPPPRVIRDEGFFLVKRLREEPPKGESVPFLKKVQKPTWDSLLRNLTIQARRSPPREPKSGEGRRNNLSIGGVP